MEHSKAGFVYTIETVRDGKVVDTEKVHNLIPSQGLDYMIEAALRQGTQYPGFYVGLYEGAYSPVPGDEMASFPVAATECVAYESATRPALILPAAAAGLTESSANKAVFIGTTDGKRVTGGFVSSTPTKGGTTGVLMSAVRFSSPKTLDAGTILRVTCGFSIIST